VVSGGPPRLQCVGLNRPRVPARLRDARAEFAASTVLSCAVNRRWSRLGVGLWALLGVKQPGLVRSEQFGAHVALHHSQRRVREILVDVSDGVAGDNDLEVPHVGVKC
jgi:hypothetical protein